MPLKAVLKIINMFLALGTFLVVAASSLLADEGLVWMVGKAVASFVLCWVVLGWLAGLLVLVVQGDESGPEPEPAPEVEKKENEAESQEVTEGA